MKYLNLGRVVGLSAYELAVKNGYYGTLEDWLNSLRYDHSEEYQQFHRNIEEALSQFNINKEELDNSMLSIRNYVTESLTELANKRETYLNDLLNKKTEYLNALNSASNSAMSEINGSKEDALNSISNALNIALNGIQTNANTWIGRFEQIGLLTKEEIERLANAKVEEFTEEVEAKKDEVINEINATETVQRITDLEDTRSVKVRYWTDGNYIFKDADYSEVATYTEIMDAINNPLNDVDMLWADAHILFPSFNLGVNDAIEFTNVYKFGGKAYVMRVIINSQNQVKWEEEEIALGAYVDGKFTQQSQQIVELSESITNIEDKVGSVKTYTQSGTSDHVVNLEKGKNISLIIVVGLLQHLNFSRQIAMFLQNQLTLNCGIARRVVMLQLQ